MRYLLCIISMSFLNSTIHKSEWVQTKLPSEILDLSRWYLTIPFDKDGKDGENAGIAAPIYQPQLKNYTLQPYFRSNEDNASVVFRAHCGGAHTPNSGYPRSELREMTGKFDNSGTPLKASWSSVSGRHEMEIRQAVIKLPTKRPQIVIGQIHDDKAYTIFFRLEGKKLFARYKSTAKDVSSEPFTENYELGTVFTVKFIAENGKTDCYYNGVKKFTLERDYSNAYFKAGAYVQSACWGKSTAKEERCDDYGEVAIYDLKVKHIPELN